MITLHFNWSLCRPDYRASYRHPFNVCSEWTLEYLSLPSSRMFCDKSYFVRSVSVDTDCNKHGQTSRSVVGTEVQASCNSETRLCDRCYVLACVRCSDGNVFLESCSNLLVHDRSFISFSSNLDLLLHKDYLQPLPSSKSSKGRCSTAKQNR